MSIDESAKAAYAEARRMYLDSAPGKVRQIDFARGARWAHDHLDVQGPTVAEVEAAEKSMKRQAPVDTPDWPEWVWTRFARAALRGARATRREETR